MISVYREFTNLKNIIKESIVVVGNFDGLHLGHKAVLDYAKSLKKNSHEKIVLFTFYPHPLKILRPIYAPKNIISFRSKVIKLNVLGIDIILAQRFNKKFSNITADNFIKIVLSEALRARHIVIGDDFRFGNKRKGDVDYLKSQENINNFKVHIIKEISSENVRCSSSLIREMIIKGKMLEVKKVLGRFHEIEGKVVKGEQLGRKLGFPTANVHYINTIIPCDGVYAGWVKFNSETYMCAISTGCRPQFKGEKRFLEAYILNFSGDIYGTRIKVLLVKKIRNEEVFSNIENLKKQMSKDCKEVIKILEENKI
ncbi:MAG: bifunctional riboflavin kinase/FAD synthetase [Dehalococcoidia bacterium]